MPQGGPPLPGGHAIVAMIAMLLTAAAVLTVLVTLLQHLY